MFRLKNKFSPVLIVKSTVILTPFILVFLSEILHVSFPEKSVTLKIFALGYMLLYTVFIFKLSRHLSFLLLLFIPFFIYGVFNSFSFNAAISEGIRYLFPIIVLLYSYSIRYNYKLLLKALIIFVLLNDFGQIINYINWINGVDQWFYHFAPDGSRFYNASAGIIRATGFVVFFGLFGFMNLVAFFLTKNHYHGKGKRIILLIFVISMFLSFSYKTIGTFLLLLFFQFKNKLKFFQIITVVFLITLVVAPSTLATASFNIKRRIEQYITDGDSARSESYRVMFSEIASVNLFGTGIGSFGGPASITYNSPFYDEVNFNWYKTPNLKTTDTYFPHLFVEMGIIGALVYLMFIFGPILFLKWSRNKIKIVLILFFSLCFDSLFSYSMNNIAFLLISIVFVYPLYFFDAPEFSKREESYKKQNPSN